MKFSPVALARQFLFVREAGQNRGQRVEAIQKWSGGVPGESWCCWFATMILDIAFQGDSPIPRLGACQDVYALAKKNGWLTDKPVEDDVVLYVDEKDHAHHIGFYIAPAKIIAGNTSADGTSSNGDRVAEHVLTVHPKLVRYVHYPRDRTIAL